MNWLHTATLIVHVLLAVGIVGLVLLQRGKGADAGAGFGAGASGTVFGARGSASFLSRTTATLAALFFVTSLALAYMGGRATPASQSVIDRVNLPADALPAPAPQPAPATPLERNDAPAQSSPPAPSGGETQPSPAP
ncbi:MAG: preprotein translocase subunit SecG [Steroidobacteraceae bacterium]